MTSLAQEMERKGDEVRMQVSNGVFLTPSKPSPLVGGRGKGNCRGGASMRREMKKRWRSCLEERNGPGDRAGWEDGEGRGSRWL